MRKRHRHQQPTLPQSRREGGGAPDPQNGDFILCECKKFISIRNTLELNSKLSVILSNEKILDTLTYLKRINLLDKI